MGPEPGYDEIARQAILHLLRREHAAVWLKIEARLSETTYTSPSGLVLPDGLNPHHLTTARHQLLNTRVIEQITDVTRGGRQVAVFALADRRRQQTAFDKAAARKRLLQTRYLGWTVATSRQPNLIGDAGERVTHTSLKAAASAGAGYQVLSSTGSHVTQLFGKPIPGGPLDNAAHLVALTDEQLPLAVTIPIEVKNVRHWMYPTSVELYQLLDKAARLQITYPSQLFVPLLVCRQAHFTTFKMAKDLGFVVHYTRIQPILPHSEAPLTAIEEVRHELGYNLEQTAGPHRGLTQALQETLPKVAIRTARRWVTTAPVLAAFYRQLRDTSISPNLHASTMDALRQAAQQIAGVGGQW